MAKGNPAVKDTIEALGVPHTEVDVISVNGESVGFYHQLKNRDRVKVYPPQFKFRNKKIIRLQPLWPKSLRFILDVHLGKLVKHLRLLGFDCLYKKDWSDEEIIKVVKRGRRILLTRDIGLLKNNIVRFGYFVRSIQPDKQIQEILKKFDLHKRIKSFSRCIQCNGLIQRVVKAAIQHLLMPETKLYYKKFYRCSRCKKIYWQGSHFQKLSRFVSQFTK